ncbi:MAG TPA: XrtA/PEP-CTERM system exopolysaccharide export protein [Rudaea sp.]|nr:XrtA/PEP-CTERM system exopolysaccharide export protein [Rudaea sp.]
MSTRRITCATAVRTALACCVLAAGAAFAAETAMAPTSPLPVSAYHIGVDDLVQVSVWHNPDLGATVPVRPDGKISLPLVGDVDAAGRTPEQVAAEVKDKLAAYIRDPQVAVILTELRSNEYLSRVRVTGAVRQPVSITYRQGMTVLDAVLAAGGPNEFAAPDRAELYRKDGRGTKSFDVRLGKIMKKGDLDTNFAVQPGDIITVPERAF